MSSEDSPLLGPPKGRTVAAGSLAWEVTIYIALTMFLDAHYNILAPNLTAIADEFGMDAKERDVMLGGAITVSFLLLGDIVAIFFGYLAEPMPRVPLFCALQLIAQLAGLGVLLVKDFWSLFWLRTITGIVCACTDLVNISLIGDLFGTQSRFTAMGIQQMVVSIGGALGQLLSGLIGPEMGWRAPLVVVSVPALLLIPVAFFTLSEPERAGQEEAMKAKFAAAEKEGAPRPSYGGTITLSKMVGIFLVPTNALIIIGVGIFGGLSFTGFAFTFLNDYLAQDKGMTVQESTLICTALNVGVCISVVASGFLAQEIYNRSRRSVGLLMGFTMLATLIPLLYLIYLPVPSSLVAVCGVALVLGLLHCVARPSYRALLINVNFPETRGTALALLKVGRSFGPGLIALLIYVGWSRVDAFTWVCVVGVTATALALGAVFFTVEADEDALQQALAEGRTASEPGGDRAHRG